MKRAAAVSPNGPSPGHAGAWYSYTIRAPFFKRTQELRIDQRLATMRNLLAAIGLNGLSAEGVLPLRATEDEEVYRIGSVDLSGPGPCELVEITFLDGRLIQGDKLAVKVCLTVVVSLGFFTTYDTIPFAWIELNYSERFGYYGADRVVSLSCIVDATSGDVAVGNPNPPETF